MRTKLASNVETTSLADHRQRNLIASADYTENMETIDGCSQNFQLDRQEADELEFFQFPNPFSPEIESEPPSFNNHASDYTTVRRPDQGVQPQVESIQPSFIPTSANSFYSSFPGS